MWFPFCCREDIVFTVDVITDPSNKPEVHTILSTRSPTFNHVHAICEEKLKADNLPQFSAEFCIHCLSVQLVGNSLLIGTQMATCLIKLYYVPKPWNNSSLIGLRNKGVGTIGTGRQNNSWLRICGPRQIAVNRSFSRASFTLNQNCVVGMVNKNIRQTMWCVRPSSLNFRRY